jgi:hypothetical protein
MKLPKNVLWSKRNRRPIISTPQTRLSQWLSEFEADNTVTVWLLDEGSIQDGSLLHCICFKLLQLTSTNSTLSSLTQYHSEQSSYGSSLLYALHCIQDITPHLSNNDCPWQSSTTNSRTQDTATYTDLFTVGPTANCITMETDTCIIGHTL